MMLGVLSKCIIDTEYFCIRCLDRKMIKTVKTTKNRNSKGKERLNLKIKNMTIF